MPRVGGRGRRMHNLTLADHSVVPITSHSLAPDNELCGKGFTFSFQTSTKMATSAFTETLKCPMSTKAFPCPFQRDFTPLVNGLKSHSDAVTP